MAYTLVFVADFGPSSTGLALNAQLYDDDGTPNGAAIAAGFVEVDSTNAPGVYSYKHTVIPDSHRGIFVIYQASDQTRRVAFSVNPEEAENTDVKTGTRSDFDETANEVDIGEVKGVAVTGVDDFKATGFAVAGDEMNLADDAIARSKFDESTAHPLRSADTGSTQVARTGADGDTLETLSDQLDGVASLTGSYDVDLQLYETGTTTPIPNVTISVKNADQSMLHGVLTTDSLGQASMSRNAGTYKLLCELSGYTFTSPETLTVTSGSVSQTIYGTPWTAPTAPTVYTCIVYGWVKDVDNTGLSGKIVSAKLHKTPIHYSGVGYTAIQSASDTTDSNGYFELTLTRSRYMETTAGDTGRYKLTIGEADLVWVIEVPDASSIAFDSCPRS